MQNEVGGFTRRGTLQVLLFHGLGGMEGDAHSRKLNADAQPDASNLMFIDESLPLMRTLMLRV